MAKEYPFAGFSILLTDDSMLGVYQQRHPKYDRFLPHLAKFISQQETIVDVGANVGDTLAGMVQYNGQSAYVCVEPQESFYALLVHNIERIVGTRPGLRVVPVKSLAGQGVSGVTLEGQFGTSHAVSASSGGLQSEPLDSILARYPDLPPVRLLKSDVDGFDYDVISSATQTLAKDAPLVFFECQYENQSQKSGFEAAFLMLKAQGYSDWTLFDNFGEIMLRTGDMNAVSQLIEYVWRQNMHGATRTIYYYDVLCAKAQDAEFVDRVLATYYAY
jgi:FkbM family methyltransferase